MIDVILKVCATVWLVMFILFIAIMEYVIIREVILEERGKKRK